MNRLMKYIFALSAILLVNATAWAQTAEQGRISGKLTDAAKGTPIDFASVVLIDPNGNKTVKNAQTDLDGNFAMSGIPNGTYTLKASFVGYDAFEKTGVVISDAQKSVNLGTLKMTTSAANALKEVVIEGQRSAIQLGIDRKVFSVEQSLVSEGGSAADLLANVPSVSVDIDGNVNLRGTDNVRILIDGKPSTLGSNMAQVLQSLPASAIETIELITNPSSKYDAEGQSGIINIVLKKNRKAGINGNVSASAGNYDNYNANGSLSYRDSRFNAYGNYGFRSGNRMGGGFSNTTYIPGNGIVNNNSDSRRNNSGHNLKLGLDYYLNDQTTIGFSGGGNFRSNSDFESLSYQYSNVPSLNGSSLRNSDRNGKSSSFDLATDLLHKFKKKGEELSANFSFGQNDEDDTQHFDQAYFNPDGTPKSLSDLRRNANTEFSNSYNIQLDYVLPIGEKQKLETGYRTSIRQNNETQLSNRFDPGVNDYVIDYNLTNDFDMEDIVHAVYASYQNQLTDKFGFQVGLRAEQAYLNTEYRGIDALTLDPTSAVGRLDYFRVYPSIFLTQKLGGEQQLQLSYTRRVNRPRGWQVNPFRDISDPNNIRMGNPNLRPEDIHSFELSYIKYWTGFTLTSSAYFRQVNDVVQGIRLPSTDNNATTISQFFNLSNSKSMGLELIGRADLSKNVNITGNVNLFQSRFAGNEQYGIRSNTGFNWNANLSSNFKLPKNVSAQVSMNYQAPRVFAQGRSREMFGTDAALKWDVFANRAGSISFNVRDVFNSRRFGQTTETSAFIQEFERRMQGRMYTLTLSYRFGKTDLRQNNRKRNEQQQQQDQMPEEQF